MAHEEKFWVTFNAVKYSHITTRYYLADAVFLAGLEGEETLLEQIDYALTHPAFPLFLGRRSCPPEGRLSLGIRKGKTLLEALQEEPWQVSDWLKRREDPEVRLPVFIDAGNESISGFVQRDLPISFDQAYRQYGYRRVSGSNSVPVANPYSQHIIARNTTEHDPLRELKEE